MESLWPRLAELPLVVESCEYDRLHAVLAHEFQRVTTHVWLVGAGAYGLGEDVSVRVEDGTSLHETQLTLPLAGEWTLAGFCEVYARCAREPRGEIDREDAERTVKRLETCPVARKAPAALGRETWRLADELGLAKTYDAEYLALAHILGWRVVTLDARLRRGADRTGLVISPAEI